METDVEVRGLPPHAWLLWLGMGILSVGIGIWLVLSPEAAITTLALLLAIALFLNGLSELITADNRFRPWFGYVLGALFLVAGVVVLLRPGKSLWFLAIFVGVSLAITGVMQVALAFVDRERTPHWVLLAVLGALGIVAGFAAMVWPDITIYVLALLIGIRLIVWGIVQLAIAFQLKSLAA